MAVIGHKYNSFLGINDFHDDSTAEWSSRRPTYTVVYFYFIYLGKLLSLFYVSFDANIFGELKIVIYRF